MPRFALLILPTPLFIPLSSHFQSVRRHSPACLKDLSTIPERLAELFSRRANHG
jgi:hypothetical protein